MGQQQLLLLVLAAIIVGAGVILGVNMFQENAAQANMDAVTQDVITIAGKAQAWYRRPTTLGGGGQTFTGITLAALGVPASNDNGGYTIAALGAGNQCRVVGTGKEDLDGIAGVLTVTATVAADSVAVTSTR